VVGRHRGIPDHRHHQSRLRRQQPPHQARSPQRLRLPQPGESTPALTLCNHPAKPKGGAPPLTSKTRISWPINSPLPQPPATAPPRCAPRGRTYFGLDPSGVVS
jgi:hypothetical protein